MVAKTMVVGHAQVRKSFLNRAKPPAPRCSAGDTCNRARPAFERQPRSKWRLFPGGVVGLGRDALLLGGKQNRASGQERGFFAVGGVDGQVGGAAQHH